MERTEYSGEKAPKHIGRYVNQLSKDIRYACSSYLVKRGVSVTGEQCRLLGYIRHRNDMGECVYQRDIERDFLIKRSSVASILANLEKGGYIVREVDGCDGRIKKVIMTEKGAELECSMFENINRVEAVISNGMNDKERDEFIRLLKISIDNIEKYENEEKETES